MPTGNSVHIEYLSTDECMKIFEKICAEHNDTFKALAASELEDQLREERLRQNRLNPQTHQQTEDRCS